MPAFVRGNIVTFDLKFIASDGSGTQPGASIVNLVYKDQGGSNHDDQVTLIYSSLTGQWSGTWDTRKSGQGTVYWMAYGYGSLQASEQGQFQVEANPANIL